MAKLLDVDHQVVREEGMSSGAAIKRDSVLSSVEAAGRPFLKWVGGKRQLLGELLSHTPRRFGCYHEPFIGGGALFFALAPKKAFLSDHNERLIRTYRGVRDSVDDVISLLQQYPHERVFFEQMRSVDIDRGSDAEVAAWMLYLNRTAYNGLYRVNRDNRFNVPFGDYKHPTICDEVRLRQCSMALQQVSVEHEDYASVLKRAKKGDFVYFDPPYVPLSKTASFTSYTRNRFTDDDQTRLRDTAVELKKYGVHVVLSNSNTEQVKNLYAKHFKLIEVKATRAINSKSSARGKISELLIVGGHS